MDNKNMDGQILKLMMDRFDRLERKVDTLFAWKYLTVGGIVVLSTLISYLVAYVSKQ